MAVAPLPALSSCGVDLFSGRARRPDSCGRSCSDFHPNASSLRPDPADTRVLGDPLSVRAPLLWTPACAQDALMCCYKAHGFASRPALSGDVRATRRAAALRGCCCDVSLGEARDGRESTSSRRLPHNSSPRLLGSYSGRSRRAPKLSSCRPAVVQKLVRRASAKSRGTQSNLDHSWPNLGETLPNSDQFRPAVQILAESWPRHSQHRSNLAELGQICANFGQTWQKTGPTPPEVAEQL